MKLHIPAKLTACGHHPQLSSRVTLVVTTQEVSLAGGQHDSPRGSRQQLPAVPGCQPWSLIGKAPLGLLQASQSASSQRTPSSLPPDRVIVKVIDCIRSLELKGNLNIMLPSAFLTVMSYKSPGNLVKMQISDFINCNHWIYHWKLCGEVGEGVVVM